MKLPKLTKKGAKWFMNDGHMDEVKPRDMVHAKRFKKTFEEVDAVLHQYLKEPTEKLLNAIALYAHVLGESYEEHTAFGKTSKTGLAKKKRSVKKASKKASKKVTKKVAKKTTKKTARKASKLK